MSTFKQYFKETFNGARMSRILENLIELKKRTRRPPFKFIWLHTDEQLKQLLLELPDNLHDTRTVQLAFMNIGEQQFKIRFSAFRDNSDRYGVWVEFPTPDILVLVDAINSGNPMTITRFKNEHTLKYLFTQSRSNSMYLRIDDDSRMVLLDLDKNEEYFRVWREIKRLKDTNSLTTDNIIACMKKMGLSDTDAIKIKQAVGAHIDPKDIDNKTLVDLL